MKKLITLGIIAVFTFSLGCTQTQNKEEVVDIDAQGPMIEFVVISHDYGTILQGGDGSYDFGFKNVGNEPLMLTNVRSSCGCTIPQWPREPIAPGETASIKVKYDTRRIGSFSKSITVTSNGSAQPIILRIKGKVEIPAAAAAQ